MIRLLELSVHGLAIGSIYALIALGWVVIYRATGIISFAQPALVILGAWCTLYFRTVQEWPWWLAVAAAAAIGGLVGGLCERLALRRMVGQPVFAAVMVTIGLDVFLRVNVNAAIGPRPRHMGDPWGLERATVGPLTLFEAHLATIATTMVLVAGVLLFLKRSRTGLGMRATALDQEAALAQGIPAGRMFNLSWVIAGGLAAVAGAFIGVGGTAITQSTWVIALKALPVIVLGGLDSILGALVGGAIIGLVETYTATYQPTWAPWLGRNFSLVAPYVVMFIVLLFRPYGLFGTREVERV